MSGFLRYGIDLGTTNSCVALFEGDQFRVFQNNDLMNVTPSVVRVLKNNRIMVGKRAYNGMIDDPMNVVSEFKRWMGTKNTKQFPITGRVMSAEELSAEVLKSLREDVHRATGEDLTTAIITVPAAFGALQCDATARAGQMAGIGETMLLQEPIAAAIAYGASSSMRNQRWLVFDLGGGTLDIAVVSTHDGQLTVLEHRGDNLLGGKDIDRGVVEQILLPALSQGFRLPDPQGQPHEHEMLLRRLTLKAEEMKIDLSSSMTSIVSLFDIGEDMAGMPIELDLTVTRAHLEAVIEPLMAHALALADDAVAGARLDKKDLAKIVLVGGPTQIPYIRTILGSHLSTPVDHSLDPMTVVARGASLYAASVESKAVTAAESAPRTPDALIATLAFDHISSELQATVVGKIETPTATLVEVRIEAQTGYWTSPWVRAEGGVFDIDVVLQADKTCPFNLYARDASGTIVDIHPDEFSIRHGLQISAPPLPHTISIETIRPNGRAELDPIFARATPLPAEKRIVYYADRTLRPAEVGTALSIKLWEGEELTDPDVNEWVGNVHIMSNMIRRPIPQDSEIDLFVRIDASRLITVEIFVPNLNQTFSDGVYLAEHEQQDTAQSGDRLARELESLTGRLVMLEEHVDANGTEETQTIFLGLRRQVEDLDIAATSSVLFGQMSDPDKAKRLEASGRNLRIQIAGLEQQVGLEHARVSRSVHADETLNQVQTVVAEHASALEKHEFEQLRKQLEAAATRGDDRGVVRAIEAMTTLQYRVLSKHDWYWRDCFEAIDRSDYNFVNPSAAQGWVARGEQAIKEGNGTALREAVRKLWDLQAISAPRAGRERALKTGLRS